MRRKLPYQVGSQVLVPLSGRWARGVVARMKGRGVILGYFFGPAELTAADAPTVLDPRDAVLVCLFGHLGLPDGTWRVLGPTPGFRPDGWPVPMFGRPDSSRPHLGYVVQYGETCQVLSERFVPIADIAGLPGDGLYGSVALERRLAFDLGIRGPAD